MKNKPIKVHIEGLKNILISNIIIYTTLQIKTEKNVIFCRFFTSYHDAQLEFLLHTWNIFIGLILALIHGRDKLITKTYYSLYKNYNITITWVYYTGSLGENYTVIVFIAAYLFPRIIGTDLSFTIQFDKGSYGWCPSVRYVWGGLCRIIPIIRGLSTRCGPQILSCLYSEQSFN